MKLPDTDPRVRSTKAMLRQSYAVLLTENPRKTISVAELCDRAGIHRSTFYAHYKDIFDLQEKLEDEIFAEFMETLSQADLVSVTGTEQVPRFLVTLFEFVKRNADLCVVFLGEGQDRRFVMKLLQCAREMTITEFSKVYKKASLPQLDMYYTFIAAGCIGLLEYWIRNGLALPAEEIARVTGLMISKGVVFLEDPGPN